MRTGAGIHLALGAALLAACGGGDTDLADARVATFDTVLDVTPTAASGSTTARFEFRATGDLVDDATFECALDGAAPAPCASPVELTGLLEGDHVFEVAARRFDGALDPTPASWAWAVDTSAPETLFVGGPAAVTASASATFEFGSDEPGATYLCSLDGAAAVPCTSPWTVEVGDGSHTLTVWAVDAAGNQDPDPLVFTWEVDTSAPDTFIDVAPAAVVGPTGIVVEFSSDDGAASFRCAVDADVPEACASPWTFDYPGGPHMVTVTAVNALGTPDPTPASASFVVDAVGPNVMLLTTPPALAAPGEPTFEFQAADAVAFTCAIDDVVAEQPCASPWQGPPLSGAEYTVRVRGFDEFGNPGEAMYTWTVGGPACAGDRTTWPAPGATLALRVEGRGLVPFLDVDTGETRYTRNLRLALDGDGVLVHADTGWPLAPSIVSPGTLAELEIEADGTISWRQPGETPVEIGQLIVATAVAPSGLAAVPDAAGFFAETIASGSLMQAIPGTDGTGEIVVGELDADGDADPWDVFTLVAPRVDQYLEVRDPIGGTPAYWVTITLHRDPTGALVDPYGWPLEPAITVPPNATDLIVGGDGTVLARLPGQSSTAMLGQVVAAERLAGTLMPGANAGQLVPVGATMVAAAIFGGVGDSFLQDGRRHHVDGGLKDYYDAVTLALAAPPVRAPRAAYELPAAALDRWYVALAPGEGYLPVTAPSGETYYVRRTELYADVNGELRVSLGWPLSPSITVPGDHALSTLRFDDEGIVTSAGADGVPQVLGQLQIARFVSPTGLRRRYAQDVFGFDDGVREYFVETEASGPPQLCAGAGCSPGWGRSPGPAACPTPRSTRPRSAGSSSRSPARAGSSSSSPTAPGCTPATTSSCSTRMAGSAIARACCCGRTSRCRSGLRSLDPDGGRRRHGVDLRRHGR
ncbi:MAG: hypothetical protein R2939_05450 [Kofleriaceae bacterium]